MIKVLLVLISVVIPVTVFSEEDASIGSNVGPSHYSKVPPSDGEFRFSSFPEFAGIGCSIITPPDSKAPYPDQGYIPCLRLGKYRLGMTFSELQAQLSKVYGVQKKYVESPRVISRTDEGITTVVIPLAAASTGDPPAMSSYLVVMYNSDGWIGALQITGVGGIPAIFMPFSSIILGTPKQQVLDILGNPSGITNVPEIKGQLWSYAPFPFTIEFMNDVVYSIRIHWPDNNDITKPFVPLKSGMVGNSLPTR